MTDSGIVEENDGTSEREDVDEKRVPVIDCCAKMLEEKEWNTGLNTDVAVCELDVVFGGDELRFCCLDGWENHDELVIKILNREVSKS